MRYILLSISYKINDAKYDLVCDILCLMQVVKVYDVDVGYDTAYDIICNIDSDTVIDRFFRGKC